MAKRFYDISEIKFQPHPTHPRFLDLTNQTYGQLTVLGFAGKHKRLNRWFCQCTCGKILTAVTGQMRSGHTKSCGCKKRQPNVSRITHNQSTTREYETYSNAKARCTNPNRVEFGNYGGRGIEFRFNSFEEFYTEIGKRPTPKHTLDRIDNNGHYEEGNVRWATRKQQCRNTRSNRLLTINGHTKCISEWAKYVELTDKAIYRRVSQGSCAMCAVYGLLRHQCPHN